MFLVKISIFVCSLIIVFVGLLLIFGRYRKVSNKVDRWFPTDGFFEGATNRYKLGCSSGAYVRGAILGILGG